MRYFIAKNSGVVVEKQATEGSDAKIDAAVNNYKSQHPTFVVTELDQATFDATVMPPQQSQAQRDWATFKASQPTAQQAVIYFAKYLALE